MYSNSIIDYSNTEQSNVSINNVICEKRKYMDLYDDTTINYYRAHRMQKTDPITFEYLDDKTAFKFPYTWNPLTGERLGIDPYGPLYFNPLTLLRHFYESRLNTLWIKPNDGYQGYYGDGVGAGEDLEIPSRGIYPERYVFRIPIQDCYLKKNHNHSIVTMGPKLTDREICEIDRLIRKHWHDSRHFAPMYERIGSLFKMKHYYTVAIAKNPNDIDLSGLDLNNKFKATQNSNNLNRIAIEYLKEM